jgi:hypothetical protein
MKSTDYRSIVSRIARNSIKRSFPGLKPSVLVVCAAEIATAVHARMYGANVDGVDSPIWRDSVVSATNPNGSHSKYDPPPNLPNVDASELLFPTKKDEND